jgi:ferritin-like metal-binding protein YciE
VHSAAVMGTEHYEINAYEAAVRLANALDAAEVGRLPRRNLDDALQRLGAEADRLTREAVRR